MPVLLAGGDAEGRALSKIPRLLGCRPDSRRRRTLTAFDHIAIAAHRIADAPDFIVGALGGRSGFGGPSPGYCWWHWDFPDAGRIEVLEPDGPASGFLHRFLKSRGPGIHHVTFRVSSLGETCARAESHGYEIVGFRASTAHWKEAFLHPKQAMGIVVQLVEVAERDTQEPSPGIPPPQAPAERPPQPVHVLGVRMVAKQRERALVQWGEVLAARVEESGDELRFHWNGSSMCVVVTLDPSAEDHAQAIELRAAPGAVPPALPEGPHPLLGARFVLA